MIIVEHLNAERRSQVELLEIDTARGGLATSVAMLTLRKSSKAFLC